MAKKILKTIKATTEPTDELKDFSDNNEIVSKDPQLHTSILLAFFIVVGISFFLRTVENSIPARSLIQNTVNTTESATTQTNEPTEITPKSTSLRDYLVKGWDYLFGADEAYAKVNLPDYGAEKYSKISEITLAPNEVKKIKIGFYNRGTYNWHKSGKNYVSLYTQDPKYHKSLLADKTWISSTEPTKIKDTLVGPNTLGYFEFSIKAPKKPGIYKETFAISAENKAWITNGKFNLTVTVTSTPTVTAADITPTKEIIEPQITDSIEPSPLTTNLFATRLSRVEQLNLNPGEETTATVMFLNKGTTSWQNRKLVLTEISPNTTDGSITFNPGNWPDDSTILENNADEVLPGRTEIYAIPLKAPQTPGIYTLHLALKSNNQNIEGGTLDLPITVKGVGTNSETSEQIVLPSEPKIRIGLFTTEEPLEISLSGNYNLEDATGQIFSTLFESAKISLAYNESLKNYSAIINGQKFVSSNALRLVAQAPENYFTITNYKRNPLWSSKINYNQFRGTIELRVAKTGYAWAINELPIDDYLKGLAEASGGSPSEYIKAQETASRSYAYYELLHPTRHIAGNFTLDAEYDQVYRGYVKEKESPSFVTAVDETKGIVVTYNGQPVSTPYFTQSNGKTKSAKSVWGNNQPWLVPVVTKYDIGEKMWGHGVGMSTNDAEKKASKEGATWDTILKYYYTGIELQKMY